MINKTGLMILTIISCTLFAEEYVYPSGNQRGAIEFYRDTNYYFANFTDIIREPLKSKLDSLEVEKRYGGKVNNYDNYILKIKNENYNDVIIVLEECDYYVNINNIPVPDNDTVYEEEYINDYGSYLYSTINLINLTDDTLIIDSLGLLIDTNKFPGYELQWNYNAPVSEYRFSNQKDKNGVLLHPELVIENYNNQYPLMGIGARDTISIWYFYIDSWLYTTRHITKMIDSTVDIAVKILFFTQNDVDTLTLMGRYTYQDNPNNIKIKYVDNSFHTNALNYNNQYRNNCFYNCLGRRISPCNKSMKNNTASGAFLIIGNNAEHDAFFKKILFEAK